MLDHATIPRTQTLRLPRCTTCDAPLALHGLTPCPIAQRRLLWRGIRRGFSLSILLCALISAALWWWS
jgi:hypothetical protein